MEIKTNNDLRKLCGATLKSWSKDEFLNEDIVGSPAHHLARIGSVDAMKEAYKSAKVIAEKAISIAGIGVSAAVGVLGFPIGLGFTAIFAPVFVKNFMKANKIGKIGQHDLALAQEVFPKIESELDQVLSASQEMVRNSGHDFASGQITSAEHRKLLTDVQQTLTAFAQRGLGISEADLERGVFSEDRIGDKGEKFIGAFNEVLSEVKSDLDSITANSPHKDTQVGRDLSRGAEPRVFDQDDLSNGMDFER